jgi:CubicO group peptidase (beta-lactamase class C family)
MMEAAIEATLQRMRSTAFACGSNDCDAIMAGYVLLRTGRDPMAFWRGQYSDEAGMNAFQDNAGGNLELVTRGMASIGLLPRCDAPQRGDVVVIDYHGRQVTGLFLDPFAAAKTASGCRMARFATILRAWSCGA